MCQMKNMNELYIIIQVIPEELKLKVILWINGFMIRYYKTKWNSQQLKKKYKIIFIIIEYNCS